jgi:hypothetical protein
MASVYLADKKVLKKLYVSKEWSANEIADLFGVSGGGVNLALKRHGIKIRSKAEAAQARFKEASPLKLEPITERARRVRWVKVQKNNLENFKLFN